MKIVVLAGGLSSEREVSLATGTAVCRALRGNGHRAILVDVFLGLEEETADLEALFDAEDGLCPTAVIGTAAPDLDAVCRSRKGRGNGFIGPRVLEICALADIVFLGLHGQDGEDGRIQAAFDLLGIPYTGAGYLASGMAMDKAVSKRMMDAVGVRTPAWQLLRYGPEDVDRLSEKLDMPCVVKTTGGGSSLGVFLPQTREELRQALQAVLAYGETVLVEQRIYGRELAVAVLGERCLPAVEIVAAGNFDYAAKYQSGGARELCPADIPAAAAEEISAMVLRLHQALGLQVYSRSDVILDEEGRAWCLEVNSLPGLTPASLMPKAAAAAGLSYAALCEEIVEQSYRLKRRN